MAIATPVTMCVKAGATTLEGLGTSILTTPLPPTSRIDPRADLAFDVEIGPGCTVGPDVRIGRGTRLMAHVCLIGDVTLGEFNAVGPFVSIGDVPQDLSYRQARTRVEIGDHNVIREGVTIHRGSEKGDGVTRIGSRNVLMSGVHVAHDCRLGDRITIAERTMLGGHVTVESDSALGRGVAVVHNVTIGRHSFVRGSTKITRDVPRYMRLGGNPSKVLGLNAAWLRRNDFRDEAIAALEEACQLLYRDQLGLRQAAEHLREHGRLTAEVLMLIEFVEAQQAGKNGRSLDRRCESRIVEYPARDATSVEDDAIRTARDH